MFYRIRVHSGDPNVLLTLLFDDKLWYNFQGVGVVEGVGGNNNTGKGRGPELPCELEPVCNPLVNCAVIVGRTPYRNISVQKVYLQYQLLL